MTIGAGSALLLASTSPMGKVIAHTSTLVGSFELSIVIGGGVTVGSIESMVPGGSASR
jgi:hypothetical protein